MADSTKTQESRADKAPPLANNQAVIAAYEAAAEGFDAAYRDLEDVAGRFSRAGERHGDKLADVIGWAREALDGFKQANELYDRTEDAALGMEGHSADRRRAGEIAGEAWERASPLALRVEDLLREDLRVSDQQQKRRRDPQLLANPELPADAEVNRPKKIVSIRLYPEIIEAVSQAAGDASRNAWIETAIIEKLRREGR